MNGQYFGGMAVGVGIGWLNATVLGLPGWANIGLMFILTIVYGAEITGQGESRA